MHNDPLAYLSVELETLRKQGLFRPLRVLQTEQAARATVDGRSIVNLSSIAGKKGGQKRIDAIRPTIPLGRVGVPDDVGAAVIWLMSDEASFITGELLEISGGS